MPHTISTTNVTDTNTAATAHIELKRQKQSNVRLERKKECDKKRRIRNRMIFKQAKIQAEKILENPPLNQEMHRYIERIKSFFNFRNTHTMAVTTPFSSAEEKAKLARQAKNKYGIEKNYAKKNFLKAVRKIQEFMTGTSTQAIVVSTNVDVNSTISNPVALTLPTTTTTSQTMPAASVLAEATSIDTGGGTPSQSSNKKRERDFCGLVGLEFVIPNPAFPSDILSAKENLNSETASRPHKRRAVAPITIDLTRESSGNDHDFQTFAIDFTQSPKTTISTQQICNGIFKNLIAQEKTIAGHHQREKARRNNATITQQHYSFMF